VGEVYEYIRHQANWETLTQNLMRLKEFFKGTEALVISPTYQALNILNLQKLLSWCQENGFNWQLLGSVVDPPQQRPHAMPPSVRHLAASRLGNFLETWGHSLSPEQNKSVSSAIHHLRQAADFDDASLRGFLRHTAALDKARNQDFSVCYPELHGLISEYLGAR
jgi:hypothetical protein